MFGNDLSVFTIVLFVFVFVLLKPDALCITGKEMGEQFQIVLEVV